MGNSQALNSRAVLKKHSKGIVVDEQKKGTVIILASQSTNIVAILTTHNVGGYGRQIEFKTELELDYGSHALPVIGFFDKDPNLETLWLEDEDDPDCSYWLLTSGRLIIQGKEHKQRAPVCEPRAKIKISVMGKSVYLTVTNPGSKPQEMSLSFAKLTQDSKPFVGAVRTGRRKMMFTLFNEFAGDSSFESMKTDSLHSVGRTSFESMASFESIKKNGFSDITSTVMFSTFDGVINVSSDHKFLTRTSKEQGNGYALLNKKIQTGIHKLKLKITVDFGASLCVGVARYPFKLSAEYIKDPMKHIYRHPGLLLWRSYRGLLYIDGKQQEKSTEALGWQHGNAITIGLVINMEDRSVELFKNERSLGIIFTDIPEVVQPVVCYYAAYEKAVELISYEVSESSHAAKLEASPQSTSLSSSSIPSSAEFDVSTKVGLMSITSDRKTVYREKNQAGNSLCLFNVTCERNCSYRFSLIVENDQGASVCVGVTNILNVKEIRINGIGNIYSSPHLYVFRSFQGMLYERGRELPKHLEEYWMTGTLLEMMIDVGENEATVQYAINGNDQGRAFTGIRPPLRPLVAFYAGMEKRVTLIHFEAKPKAVVRTVKPELSPNRFTRLQSLQSARKPIIMRMREFGECAVCRKPVDCLALPCEHTRLCAEHLSASRQCPCGEKSELRMWNFF